MLQTKKRMQWSVLSHMVYAACPVLRAIFEGPDVLFWAQYYPHVSSGVCAYVKSSRSQELEVLLAQFPESFPMPMKMTQSELVLTRVDSPN